MEYITASAQPTPKANPRKNPISALAGKSIAPTLSAARRLWQTPQGALPNLDQPTWRQSRVPVTSQRKAALYQHPAWCLRSTAKHDVRLPPGSMYIGSAVRAAYLAAGTVTTGAVPAGAAFRVKIFNAFCTVWVRPQPVGTTTINHAAATRAGEDFRVLKSLKIKLLVHSACWTHVTHFRSESLYAGRTSPSLPLVESLQAQANVRHQPVPAFDPSSRTSPPPAARADWQ